MCLALWYGRRAAPSAPRRGAQGVRDMHVRRDSFRPLGRGRGHRSAMSLPRRARECWPQDAGF